MKNKQIGIVVGICLIGCISAVLYTNLTLGNIKTATNKIDSLTKSFAIFEKVEESENIKNIFIKNMQLKNLIQSQGNEKSITYIQSNEKKIQARVAEEAKIAAEKEREARQKRLYADDNNYPGFCGRLHIPSAGIDVALYSGWAQGITDRADSANLFYLPSCASNIIADHSNQSFRTLSRVRAGTTAYIQNPDGSRINLVCAGIHNGHNIDTTITDANYVPISGYDYITYTCQNHWTNVRVCTWNVC